jgi:hypothetical protein
LIAHWPEVVRQGFEAYGYESVRQRPLMLSAVAISQADEAVVWLIWLDDAARRIIWARASGISWRRLENLDGRSHSTLRRIEAKGFDDICRRLNAALDPRDAVAAAFRQGRENRVAVETKL